MTDKTLPRVSVIIPTFNYARFLERCINSALGQSYPNVEVVVVDDGSTDGTPEVLAPFEATVLTLRQPNNGVAAARNAGVAASTGELLAFLDADDYWHSDKLARQVAALAANDDIGLVHCGVQQVDPDGHFLTVQLDGADGKAAVEMLLMRTGMPGGGSAALIPRVKFDEVGGFDTEMSTSADFDLYLRIAAGSTVHLIREPLVYYTLHSANMHRNVAAMERDMTRAYAKAFAYLPASADLRRAALAKLHLVLAGSYLHAGKPWDAIRHAATSCAAVPSYTGHVLATPVRVLRRRAARAR